MRNVLGWIGRVLLTSGILLLLFVAYQLWGTGIYQSRQQDKLRDQFEQTVQKNGHTTTTLPSTATTLLPTATTLPATATTGPDNPTITQPTTGVQLEVPPHGDPVASISIPKIGVSKIVVEGVDVPDLREGPGHYPVTPLPGQEGNTAIAGHRTTYGAPFGDLDQLAPGDEITVTTLDNKTWTYKVNQDSPFVVKPTQGEVLQPTPDPTRPGHALATLTLTTCNPKYSAAERLIVQATIVLPPGAVPLPADRRSIPGRRPPRSAAWARTAVVAHPRAPLGPHRRARRWRVVVPVPPLQEVVRVDRRRDPLHRRLVRLLHVPRAAPAVELLIEAPANQDSSMSAMTSPASTGCPRST